MTELLSLLSLLSGGVRLNLTAFACAHRTEKKTYLSIYLQGRGEMRRGADNRDNRDNTDDRAELSRKAANSAISVERSAA